MKVPIDAYSVIDLDAPTLRAVQVRSRRTAKEQSSVDSI